MKKMIKQKENDKTKHVCCVGLLFIGLHFLFFQATILVVGPASTSVSKGLEVIK